MGEISKSGLMRGRGVTLPSLLYKTSPGSKSQSKRCVAGWEY